MKVLNDNKTIKKLITIIIVISIAFALFLIPIMIKNWNGEYCNTEQSKTINNNYINSSIVLSSNNSYFLTKQNFPDQQTYVLKTDYCFKANNNGTVPLSFSIIDSELVVLKNGFFPLGTSTVCTSINTSDNVLGVKCLDCNVSNSLMFFDDPTSSDEIINLNGVLSLSNPLSVNNINYFSCGLLAKKVFMSYIYFLSLMGFLFLIIWGVDGFGGFLLEW